jgi:hypothetical protein
MEGLSDPDRLKEIPVDDLTKTFKKGSHGRIGYERAVHLNELAEASFGIPRGSNGRSIALRFVLNSLSLLIVKSLNL